MHNFLHQRLVVVLTAQSTFKGELRSKKETYTVVAVQSNGRADNQKNEPKRHKLIPHHEMSERIERESNSEKFKSILMGLTRSYLYRMLTVEMVRNITRKSS